MKTAKISRPLFSFGSNIQLKCPECHRVTQHDSNFEIRNAGKTFKCGDIKTGDKPPCGKQFQIPGGQAKYTSAERATAKQTTEGGFLGMGGKSITKVKCPYCKQENIKQSGTYEREYAGQHVRCEFCQDVFQMPGQAQPVNRPAPKAAAAPVKKPTPTPALKPAPQKVWVACNSCQGAGRIAKLNTKACSTCGGSGKQFEIVGEAPNAYKLPITCQSCGGMQGTRETTWDTCLECNGQKGWYR